MTAYRSSKDMMSRVDTLRRVLLETSTPTEVEARFALEALKDQISHSAMLKPIEWGPIETFNLRVFVRAVSDLAVWTGRRYTRAYEYEQYLSWIANRRGHDDVMRWSRKQIADTLATADSEKCFRAIDLVNDGADRFLSGEGDEWFELTDLYILRRAGHEVRDLERERRASLEVERVAAGLSESGQTFQTDIDAQLKAITEAARGGTDGG